LFKLSRLSLILAAASTLSAFPNILQPPLAVNAATGKTSLSPGSYLSVTPTLGPALTFTATNYQNYFVELLTSDGATHQLTPLLSPGQPTALWFVIPANAPLGQAAVRFKREPDTGELATFPFAAGIQIVATAPGLFTKSYTGMGPVLATDGTLKPIALTNASVPGQQIAMWATGLGGARTGDVTVEIAGKPTSAVFAGAHSAPGLDQINFIVPADAKFGCYVPLAIRVRGVLSNTVALSINDNPKGCAHPLGLSYSDLVALDAGQSVPLARFFAFSTSASLTFDLVDADMMFVYSRLQGSESNFFGCIVGIDVSAYIVQSLPLDAGPSVAVSGPGGRALALPGPFYSLTVPELQVPFFTAGLWQVSAPGGANLKSFAINLTLPPDFTSVQFAPEIAKDRDFTVTWNPAGYSAGDVAYVSLSSSVSCRVRAWEGSLTIPKALLSGVTPGTGTLSIYVGPFPAARPQFSLERTDGTRLPGIVDYGFGSSKLVTILP
jgi:uncharacterized protein (TIGR03437 family)